MSHVVAVRLQDLYQGGGGGQGQGLGGPSVGHAETQAQATHDDETQTLYILQKLFRLHSSTLVSVPPLLCQMSK